MRGVGGDGAGVACGLFGESVTYQMFENIEMSYLLSFQVIHCNVQLVDVYIFYLNKEKVIKKRRIFYSLIYRVFFLTGPPPKML